MTTTLSEGVKVPDVGSTDWADDLETNWNLLNTALAQQGSWAKTNEAQTFTGVQTFSDGIVGSLQGTANMAVSDEDGNSITTTYATKTELSTLSDTVGTKANDNAVVHNTGAETIAGAKTFSDTLTSADVVPSTTDTYSLGSASYQWNNAYIKSLTINGVACGDILTHNASEFVNTTTAQTIDGSKTFSSLISKSSTLTRGSLPTTSISEDPIFVSVDKNNKRTLGIFNYYNTNGDGRLLLCAYNQNTTNYDNIGLAFGFDNTNSSKYIGPAVTNSYSLGSSSYKWKDCYTNAINGINPGALGLPDYDSAVNIDTTDWSTAGVRNTYTPTISGWLQITVSGGSGSYMTILDSGITPRAGQRITGDGIDRLFLTHPVVAGHTYLVYIVSSEIVTARIVPCLGNV